jgi:N-acetylneuraminate synthase
MFRPNGGAFLIAEAGVNHNGDIEKALALIDIAADAGADAVKFQTFVPEEVISRSAPKAEYQMRTTGETESQLAMVRKLRLSDDEHHRLVARCAQRGIRFLSTPFDLPSLAFLVNDIGVDALKIPSGDLTNAPLLLAAAHSNRPLIVSTGMATLDDVREALGVFAHGFLGRGVPSRQAFDAAFASAEGKAVLKQKVSLLHCTTEYPAPYADVNLRAMDTLAETFGLAVGLSDHTPGIAVAIAAVARGAVIIEKHFTLDRNLPGPDHAASLTPDEVRALVREVRHVEQAMGSPVKAPAPSEIKNMAIARKSLVARRNIRAGEVFAVDMVTAKRPGNGVSPMRMWEVLGTKARRDYAADEQIDG